MPGPEAHTIAVIQGSEPPLDIGSRLCTQCGLCCTGALHNYAVLQPGEVEFARGLGLAIRTEGKPGFALPCPRLVNSKCSIYENRPKVCGKYKCQLLENLEAGTTELDTALGKVLTAKELVARVGSAMPSEMTLPNARERAKVTILAEADASPAEPSPDMPLRLAVTALSLYLDKYFRNTSEGKMLSLESVAEEQLTTEMK